MKAYSMAAVKNRLLKYFDAETVRLMRSDHELCDMLMKAAELQRNHEDADFALEVYETLPPMEYTVEEPVIEEEVAVEAIEVHLSTDEDLEEYLELQTAPIKEEEVNIVQKLVEAIQISTKPNFPMHNGLVIVTKKGKDYRGNDVVTTHLVLPENLESHLEKYHGWELVTI